MRLTRKLIIALTCAIFIVLGINAMVRIKREVVLFESDIRRDSRLLGRTLAGAVKRIWTTVGEAEALDLVKDANQRASHGFIRWRWLEDEAESFETPDARRLLALGQEIFETRPSPAGAGTSLYTYVPVALPDGRLAALELSESLAAEQQYLRRTVVQAIITTSVLVVVCGFLATALGMIFVGRPIRGLVEQARRIGAGDLSPTVSPPGPDEIGELAREMNAMCERLLETRSELEVETASRLVTQEQLRHADRLTTVGKLAAGIAHEVGTPLNVITGYAQLVKDDYPAGSTAHDNVLIIAEQADRVAAIIRQLLDFARQRTPNKNRHDLHEVVRQVVPLLDALAQKRRVQIDVEGRAEEIAADFDFGQIEQVITNLIVNGVHSMPRGGRLVVRVDREHARHPDQLELGVSQFGCISVEDHGVGIASESLPRIFEPFFTTKGVGEGTGLGLSVAYGIVKEHGGWIDVKSTLGSGTRFAVYLPLGELHA